MSRNRIKAFIQRFLSYLKGRIGWQGLTADEFIDEGPYLITGTDFENGKIQFDRSYHISDERYNQAPEIQLKVGDLLVTKDGTVGKMAYVDTLPGKASLNSHLLLIRPLENKFDNRFLFWLMSSSVFNGYTEYAQDGTVMASLSQEKIGNFIAYFPEITEQQAIADFLDKECAQIDSIAADLEKQIVLLQQYKKSLITETVTKGLDKSVPMKDSGVEWIGKIPAHWDFKRLKFMLENSSDSMKVGPFGSALSGSDFTDEGKWVYNQRVVLDNNFSENTTFVSEEKFQEMRSFAVYPGDILITTRGTIGKVAIVPEGANEGILHPCIIKFRVDKEMIIPELLQLIFNESDFVKDQFTLMSNATTIEVIYSSQIASASWTPAR
ncbi:restriction endonuclease subunit S [Intestinimonas sp. HCP28S3_D6]|uniref:restriction endonuclease subunit S n=1 Tax=Intestinimonas sp. HCP28S3_D6 TaxID=3438942 RepID=UPI003F8C3D97